MESFNIDYDDENDSLFVYLKDSKSKGAVEIGNFILDFDNKGNLVAMEILDASEVFKVILSKMVKLSSIKEFRADIINFRNRTNIIRFSINDDSIVERGNIIIPRVVESPALNY